jgi:hypothetical protein
MGETKGEKRIDGVKREERQEMERKRRERDEGLNARPSF